MRPGALELMIRHIGFAERWLARAKAECTRGHAVRGALTLLLAEAEVHHAREAVTPDASAAGAIAETARMNRLLLAAAAAAICVVGVILAVGAGSGPLLVSDDTSSPAPVFVRLKHDVGSVLALVPSASSAARDGRDVGDAQQVQHVRASASERSEIVPPSETAANSQVDSLSQSKRALSSESRPIARPKVVKTTHKIRVARHEEKRRLRAVPASSQIPSVSSADDPGIVSDADLIDLVLAAERSLRTGSR